MSEPGHSRHDVQVQSPALLAGVKARRARPRAADGRTGSDCRPPGTTGIVRLGEQILHSFAGLFGGGREDIDVALRAENTGDRQQVTARLHRSASTRSSTTSSRPTRAVSTAAGSASTTGLLWSRLRRFREDASTTNGRREDCPPCGGRRCAAADVTATRVPGRRQLVEIHLVQTFEQHLGATFFGAKPANRPAGDRSAHAGRIAGCVRRRTGKPSD